MCICISFIRLGAQALLTFALMPLVGVWLRSRSAQSSPSSSSTYSAGYSCKLTSPFRLYLLPSISSTLPLPFPSIYIATPAIVPLIPRRSTRWQLGMDKLARVRMGSLYAEETVAMVCRCAFFFSFLLLSSPCVPFTPSSNHQKRNIHRKSCGHAYCIVYRSTSLADIRRSWPSSSISWGLI